MGTCVSWCLWLVMTRGLCVPVPVADRDMLEVQGPRVHVRVCRHTCCTTKGQGGVLRTGFLRE